jgi:sugar/nucleoside kinase (ribokinase family)
VLYKDEKEAAGIQETRVKDITMKILVLGHLCIDTFTNRSNAHPGENDDSIRWGGIFFSLATMAHLAKDAEVFPIFGVGTKEYEPFLQRIERYQNVNPSGLYRLPGSTNHVYLEYTEGEKRVECSKSIATPIPFQRIEACLPADAILVNMISGFDITLDTLSTLRMLTQANQTIIHLDIHSLTLGIDEAFRRFHRPLETWRRWCYLADSVQMNEDEAKALPLEYLAEEDLAKQILSLGLRGLLITRGTRGVTAWRQEHKKMSRTDIPAVNIEGARDSTGCGDVFAAAFCYHLTNGQNVTAAARLANRIAAANVLYVGSDGIDTIAETLRSVGEGK